MKSLREQFELDLPNTPYKYYTDLNYIEWLEKKINGEVSIRKYILDDINKIKSDENNFTSRWWKNNYVSYTKDNSHMMVIDFAVLNHLSNITFEILNSEDLTKIYKYIVLRREEISQKRVQEDFFD